MVKLQLLKDSKIIVYNNTLKVFKNDNNLALEIQTKDIQIVETDNHVEISTEEESNKPKRGMEFYEIELSNIDNYKQSVVKAIKETFNLSLEDAKDLCKNDPSFVCLTKDKEEAIKTWSILKTKLYDTNVKIILHEAE